MLGYICMNVNNVIDNALGKYFEAYHQNKLQHIAYFYDPISQVRAEGWTVIEVNNVQHHNGDNRDCEGWMNNCLFKGLNALVT